MKCACAVGILANVLLIFGAAFLLFDFTPLDLLPKNRNLHAALVTLESEIYLTKDVPGAKMKTADGQDVIPKTEQAEAVIGYIKDHTGELPAIYSWDRVVGAMLSIVPATELNLTTNRTVELIILPKNENYRTMFPPIFKFEDLRHMLIRDHQRRVHQTVGLLFVLGFALQGLTKKRLSRKTEPL